MSAPSIHELCTGDHSIMNTTNQIVPKDRIERDKKIKVCIRTPSMKECKRRLYVSADNSPILSRRMKSQSDNSEQRCNLQTKLLIPNMDKVRYTQTYIKYNILSICSSISYLY